MSSPKCKTAVMLGLLALCRAACGIELSSWHPNPDGQFGCEVLGLPDMDGDGYGDVLISEPGAGGTIPDFPSSAGVAYLVNGRTGVLLHEFSSPNKTRTGNFSCYGETYYHSTASFPDVDGDDVPELLMGAVGDTIPGQAATNGGAVYMFSGKQGSLIQTFLDPEPSYLPLFGCNVYVIPDQDGDGRPDVAISSLYSPRLSLTNTGPGKMVLFSSATGLALRSLYSNYPYSNGRFSKDAVVVDDVTGDGKPDLIVSAAQEFGPSGLANSGLAYLFDSTTWEVVREIKSEPAVAQDRFGQFMYLLPDMNDDGKSDIAVPTRKNTAASDGVLNIISPGDGSLITKISSPEPRNGGGFGHGFTLLPDQTGDGFPDAAIGAAGEYSPPDTLSAGGRIYFIDLADGTEIRRINVPQDVPGTGFGLQFSTLPDVSGDGYPDLAAGAPRADGGRGRVYILDGKTGEIVPPPPLPTPSATPTPSPTESPTPSPTLTPTPSPSPTLTSSPTASPTFTSTPTPSATFTPPPSPTPILNSAALLNFLLGRENDPAGLDLNTDGAVDIGDLILASFIEF